MSENPHTELIAPSDELPTLPGEWGWLVSDRGERVQAKMVNQTPAEKRIGRDKPIVWATGLRRTLSAWESHGYRLISPRAADALAAHPQPTEDGAWSCAHCGQSSVAHGIEGHPSYACVYEPVWVTR